VAKPPKAFDVWFVAANTFYKAVPYNVVADWAQQGRLAPTDMVRPAGTSAAWAKVETHEFLADYLPRPTGAKATPAFEVVEPDAVVSESDAAAPVEHVELPDPEPPPRRRAGDEDDEVDMIPLIDVSMVLLVFFIIMRAAGALAPVDVPEMRFGGELSDDPNALTITIDMKDEDNVFYSVRVGQTPAKTQHDQLATPEDAMTALDDLLIDLRTDFERNNAGRSLPPPEVRIACRKELPRERVYELRREIERRQRAAERDGKQYINAISATVVEAPNKP
jgi:biopolymer transport protein ExbD